MVERLLDLRRLPVLEGVGDGPGRAAQEWLALDLDGRLRRFDPVNVSSLASGLDVDGSDLDVVCDLRAGGFVETVTAAFGGRAGFRCSTAGGRTVVSFMGDRLRVELFGERLPVEQQWAYRHAVTHRRVVDLGGLPLARAVRDLREREHLKTDPALAAILGADGDPYARLNDLADTPRAALEHLVDAAIVRIASAGAVSGQR